MPKFRLFKTETFDKDFSELDGSDRKRVEKILDQLLQQGDAVGKPLSGLSFFREKKFGGKRLYFLVYAAFSVILAVGISGKKAQQLTINKILLDLADYQKYVFDTLKKEKII